jgi:2-polyprenyl-3-methyl-5-hydroxy-6-metoxy-1,4-benzoquinol methylase
MISDLQGQAILDHYQNRFQSPLLLHNSYGEPEDMPIDVFFREEEDLSVLELLALIECKGSVLDIGAAAGVHSLILESRGFDVSAMDLSPGCCEVMKASGISRVLQEDYRKHAIKYDTLLLLMNGLGIAGNLDGIQPFLQKCKKLLKPGGQVLVDSSDISYLYEEGLSKPDGYYGEIRYRYEYKKQLGEWFEWIYLDSVTLKKEVKVAGMQLEILHTDENDQYLARITA